MERRTPSLRDQGKLPPIKELTKKAKAFYTLSVEVQRDRDKAPRDYLPGLLMEASLERYLLHDGSRFAPTNSEAEGYSLTGAWSLSTACKGISFTLSWSNDAEIGAALTQYMEVVKYPFHELVIHPVTMSSMNDRDTARVADLIVLSKRGIIVDFSELVWEGPEVFCTLISTDKRLELLLPLLSHAYRTLPIRIPVGLCGDDSLKPHVEELWCSLKPSNPKLIVAIGRPTVPTDHASFATSTLESSNPLFNPD
jgi:hypothetical protein